MPTHLERIKTALLDAEEKHPDGAASYIVRTARFVATVVIEFQRHMCITIATALTLTSLLSMVPLFSMLFAVFSAFEGFSSLRTQAEEWVLGMAMAKLEFRETIATYLHDYTRATTKMEIINVAALLLTSILLFVAIEHALSVIWGIKKRRGYFESVMVFTSFIVLAPLLLGCSFYLTGLMSNFFASTEIYEKLTTNEWVILLFKHCVSWLLFFFGYVLIPYTRVNYRSALIGSFIASNTFEGLKHVFEIYLRHSHFHKTIYGQLSVIPVFLLWLYLFWVIFLIGAEIAYCHQYRRLLRLKRDSFDDRNPPKGEMAIILFLELAREFSTGSGPVQLDSLCRSLSITPAMARLIFERFEEKALVSCVERDIYSYLPAKRLNTITLNDLYDAVQSSSFIEVSRERERTLEREKHLLNKLRGSVRDMLNVKVSDFIDV